MSSSKAKNALNKMKIGLKKDGSFPMACGITIEGQKAVKLMEDLGLSALPVSARKIEGDNAPTNNIQDWIKASKAEAANSTKAPMMTKAANLTSAPKRSAPKPSAA